jgi:hypothetical protein
MKPVVITYAVKKCAEDMGPELARVCELLPSREIRKFVRYYINSTVNQLPKDNIPSLQ